MSKRPILLALIAIVFSCCRADKGSLAVTKSQYKITGKIKGLRDSTWIYLDKTTELDSSMLINGRFSFMGTIAEKAKPVVLGTKPISYTRSFGLKTIPFGSLQTVPILKMQKLQAPPPKSKRQNWTH